jgi:hypothetical protein
MSLTLSEKFELTGPVRSMNQPTQVDLAGVAISDDAPGIIGFIRKAADHEVIGTVYEAARADDDAWLCYPKGRQLGTDVNRVTLTANLPKELRAVCQISIDHVWSALKLRPVATKDEPSESASPADL